MNVDVQLTDIPSRHIRQKTYLRAAKDANNHHG